VPNDFDRDAGFYCFNLCCKAKGSVGVDGWGWIQTVQNRWDYDSCLIPMQISNRNICVFVLALFFVHHSCSSIDQADQVVHKHLVTSLFESVVLCDQTARRWFNPDLSLTNYRTASSATHRWSGRISLFIFEWAKKWSDFHWLKLPCACKINRWVNQLWIQRLRSPKFGLS